MDPSLSVLLLDDIDLGDTQGEQYSDEAAAERYTSLSYSSLNLLHDCPRKFQLYRLIPHLAKEQSVHLSYGTVVGIGMQDLFSGRSMDDIVFDMFLAWDMDIDFVDAKAGKSLWFAIEAIQYFEAALQATDLRNWEPVIIDGKPAAELGFRIKAGSYFYRGFIDLVIRHRETSEIAVLECKTAGAQYLNQATYGNSAQGVSYSLPLDQLFPDLSSYTVYYLVYMTQQRKWEIIPFEKHLNQRAEFIRDLIYDIRTLEMYKEEGFPKRGSACVSFNRTCTFYGSCGMSTQELAPVLLPMPDDAACYQYTFDLEDIIARQEEHVNEIV